MAVAGNPRRTQKADRKPLDTSSPLKAIRAMCLECVGYVPQEVVACTGFDCSLYPFRLGRAALGGHSRLKAVKAHCLACMGGRLDFVKTCPSGPAADGEPGCPVYSFRLGRNPNRKGKGGSPAHLKTTLDQPRELGFQAPESTISSEAIG